MSPVQLDRLLGPELTRHAAAEWTKRRWAQAASFLPHAGVVLLACLGVWAVKKQDLLAGEGWTAPLLLAVICAVLAPIRSAQVAKPLLIVHRTIFLLFTVYAVIAYPAVSDAYINESAWTAFLHLHVRWVAVLAAILAWFRPGFGLMPVVLMAWKKHLLADQFGFSLNETDYYPVAELALYTTFAVGAAAAADALSRRWQPPRPFVPDQSWSFGDAAFLGAFAIHIANYFYSAIAKVTLPGADFLTWVLENETHYIMMATWSIGLGPLHSADWMGFLGHEFMARFQHVTNLITFAGQLAGLICILRIRWAMLLTGFYDVMHLIIFVTTSILFWKWMTLNIGLVLAFKAIRHRKVLPWPLIVMTIAVTLLSPLIFRVATLGWFDTAALNRAKVEAVLEDGTTFEVPNTYFLEASAQMAKSRVGSPFEGHFDIGVFGKANGGRTQMHAARSCDLPVGTESGLARSFEREPKLEKFFREHHRYVLSRVDGDGRLNTWLFPHHNWANPQLYEDFAAADLRDIVRYRYIIESLCLSYGGSGRVEEDIRLRGVYEIEVDEVTFRPPAP